MKTKTWADIYIYISNIYIYIYSSSSVELFICLKDRSSFSSPPPFFSGVFLGRMGSIQLHVPRQVYTLPETNWLPMKIPIFPGKYHFKWWIFHGYVSLQECNHTFVSKTVPFPPRIATCEKPLKMATLPNSNAFPKSTNPCGQ